MNISPHLRLLFWLALLSVCTALSSSLLENDLTGVSPIYFQAGVVVTVGLALGWRYLLFATVVLVGVMQWHELSYQTREFSVAQAALQFGSFFFLGWCGLFIKQRFGSITDLVRSKGILGVLSLLIGVCGVSALLLLFTDQTFDFGSIRSTGSLFVATLLALVAGVLLAGQLTLMLIRSDWQLFKQSRSVFYAAIVGVCFALWYYHDDSSQQKASIENHVSDHGTELSRALTERTIAHSEVLKSLVRLIEYSPDLSQSTFDNFVALTLHEYSDISALSFNPIIKAEYRPLYEEKMRQLLSNSAFSIKERRDGIVTAAQPHTIYLPVTLISPLESNAKAVGFDIFSNEVRRAAVESALANNRSAVTAPITLVQETGERMAVLLLEPVWNSLRPAEQTDIVGFAVSVLKVDELFSKNLIGQLRPGIRYRLKDSEITDADFDFVNGSATKTAYDDSYMTISRSIPVADRIWTLELQPSTEYLLASTVAPSQLNASFVFCLAGLLVGFTQLGAVRKADIESTVEEQTKIIKEKMEVANVALAELRTHKEQQERLFAIIGHELRTPVSAVKMMLDAHQGEFDKGPHSSEIRSTVEHLLSVLDDMRYGIRPEEIQRIEQTISVPEQVIERTLNANAPQLRKAGLEVSFKRCELTPQAYLFSEKALRQILHNLLRNATLHSGASRLDIYSKFEQQSPETIRLTIKVEDNGRGIAAHHLERLFEPFYRGNNDVDGTGLGLSICRQLARDHGGDLVYYETDQGGAGFNLTLLLSEGDSKSESGARNPALVADSNRVDRLDGVKVLYAEDNPTIQLLTKTILAKLGAEVSVANNGEEALEIAQSETFDLVVTDIFMPKLDGYGLTAALREKGFTGCIVGVTAATVGDESDHLLQSGATAVLPKPLDVKKLMSVYNARHRKNIRSPDPIEPFGVSGETEV